MALIIINEGRYVILVVEEMMGSMGFEHQTAGGSIPSAYLTFSWIHDHATRVLHMPMTLATDPSVSVV